jgi:hypothetical protein
MDDLKPCPFCGKPGSIDEEQSKGNPDHVVFVPSCSDSDCIGVLIQSFARRGDAITAWNTRTLPNPTPDVADLVKRLTDYAVSDHSRGCQGRCYECTCGYDAKRDPLLDEAVDMLTLLQAQVVVARKMVIEEAAKVCDEAAARCRANEQEQYGRCNDKGADIWAIRAVANTQRAAAIRALTPPDPAGGMLEKVKEE